MPAPILVVDDDGDILAMLTVALGDWGYDVDTAGGGAEALAAAGRRHYSVILMDVRMDTPRDGILALLKIRAGDGPNRRTPVVVMTAYAEVQDAVDALKGGASDYLFKPLDLNVMRHAVEGALGREPVSVEAGGRAGAAADCGLIGTSEAFLKMRKVALRAAPARATVLITGESGTGKELVARLIAQNSPRASEPFVAINCAALTETLLESELFGHVAGAFNEAVKRGGRLKAADGGTVFLDEIADTSPAFQAKLLRTLQEGEIQPVGSDRLDKVDVRFIAATNRDIEGLVRRGEFRDDLYYRLNVIRVEVPPLRERGADLDALAEHFVAEYAARNGSAVRGLDPGAMEAVRRHSWPGNVRELQNAMERAVILAEGDLVTEADMAIRFEPSPFPAPAAGDFAGGGLSPSAFPASTSIDDKKRKAAEDAMIRRKGVIAHAAVDLKITRKTLAAWLKKFDLEHLKS
ncbi:MAG: sigma-54 dependent transcriptional regulator [Deltaproteobacteria bacterium]|jgi:two-component system response regulator HydG|nr:sigma-54 dependent transcriptional regulator [Deltaproteobacteria bacterium]